MLQMKNAASKAPAGFPIKTQRERLSCASPVGLSVFRYASLLSIDNFGCKA